MTSTIALNPNESVEINIDKKSFFDMNTERNRKRIFQMQKRKAQLNDTDSPPIADTAQTTPHRIEELTTPFNEGLPLLEPTKQKQCESNLNVENENNNESDIELNVSNLDCSVEIHDEDNSNANLIKQNLSSSSKSFIPLNNNLIAKAAANNEKSTSSYMLALCPELFSRSSMPCYGSTGNRTSNYEVDDIIKEENEVDSTAKKERFASGGKITPFVGIFDKRHVNTEVNKSKEKKKIKNNIGFNKNIKKIPYHNKSSSMIEKNENKSSRPIKINHSRQGSMILSPKVKINTSSSNTNLTSSGYIKPRHMRSQTTMTSPNMLKVNQSSMKIKKGTITERLSCDYKAKKLSFPHKTAPLIYPSITSTHSSYERNSSLIFTQHSTNNLLASNKPKIIAAMQHLKFSPLSSYSYALNALNKSKKDLFCIMICNDIKTNHFIFRGLYEIHHNDDGDNVIAYKIYSSSFCENKRCFKDIKSFYTYHPQSQYYFTKYKPDSKYFDTNTILMK